MDVADGLDDDLLDRRVQLIVEESCQRENAVSTSREEDSRLLRAIQTGDVETLREVCDAPAAFSRTDESGWYPLHRAVVQPLVTVLETVLYASFGLTLEEKTAEGETFLTLAVRAGLLPNVRTLLAHGASPHTTNCRNESPLLLAVRAGSRHIASCLISGGAEVEQVCLKRWTAVHEACRTGCADVLELLLQNGGQVTKTDQHGVTPLGIAAEYGHPDVMEILIQHGADVNAQAPNGDSVLYDAAGSGNPDCVSILLRHGANPNVHNLSCQLPIHRAAYEGNLLALRMLIPVSTRRALRLSAQSPVHSAADGGHLHCLRALLQRGFDVNALLAPRASENYGDLRRTPLCFAVCNGDAACTEALLRMGAEPDLDPLRCLLVAVRSGRYRIVELLLEAGADVNCFFTAVHDTVFPTALRFCLKDEVMLRMLLGNGYRAEECFRCNHGNERDDGSEDREGKVTFCDFVSVSCMVNLVGRVVSILLEYVGQVSLCARLVKTLQGQTEWPEILRTACNPRPLTHLSRVAIRKRLRFGRLKSAQLPSRLKDFLMFRENDLYGREFSP